MPNFRKGSEAAKEAAKGTPFPKTHFFGIDDGESEIVRFITDMDEWIVVDQHGNVNTRPRPDSLKKADGKDANWPQQMGAVCRKDSAFEGMFPDCYICDFVKKPDGKPNRPSGRSWLLGCLREVVRDEQTGQILGYRDKKRDVAVLGADGKPTGETNEEKAIVIFNMGFKNFLGILKGFGDHYGTVLDRDYMIKRDGVELKTTYQIIPMDPVPNYDLRDPEIAALYATDIDLAAEVTARASDEFYDRFFDIRHPFPESKSDGDSGSSGGAPAEQQSKPNTELAEADLAALAARVKGHEEAGAPPVPAGAGAPAAGGLANFAD